MMDTPSKSGRQHPATRLICVERQVLHKHYRTGIVSPIGRVIERRQHDRGSNFLDLLRKARLLYGRKQYDIGAIFLGPVVARFSLPNQLRP